MVFLGQLTKDQCIDWRGVRQVHIRFLLHDRTIGAIAYGLRNEQKKTAENKMMLYLNHLRYNLSLRGLAICFRIYRSTLSSASSR